MSLSKQKIVQIVLSASLILALTFLVDWREVWSLTRSVEPIWLAAAALFVVLARIAVTLRWQILLKAGGLRVGFGRLFHNVSAGIGIGSMLPTSVGPDIARGVLFAKDGGDGAQLRSAEAVVSSLLLDRFAAMVGTFLVAFFAALNIGQSLVSGLLGAILVVGIVALILLLRAADTLFKRYGGDEPGKFMTKLITFRERLKEPGLVRFGLIPAVFASTLMTFARVGIFICIYKAFGYDISLELALFAIPMMLIALIAPITIGGFGVREWVLVMSFEQAGVPPEVSVSVGILSFALQLLVSAPAILRVLIESHWGRARPDHLKPELKSTDP